MDAKAVSLFDNEREANLTSTVEMVEAALIELGHEALDSRRLVSDADAAWRFRRGSAMIDIQISDGEPMWTLRVSAIIMTCDDTVDRLGLYRRLLSANSSEVTGAAFAIEGDAVLLVSERDTVDLDPSEVSAIINRVQSVADELDDRLVEEFGGTLGAPDAR